MKLFTPYVFLIDFPRVDPDGDAPRTHLKNPAVCLHARAAGVSADRGSQAGAALPQSGSSPQPPPALPQLPQIMPKPEYGGRWPNRIPDHTAGGRPHCSGTSESF